MVHPVGQQPDSIHFLENIKVIFCVEFVLVHQMRIVEGKVFKRLC